MKLTELDTFKKLQKLSSSSCTINPNNIIKTPLLSLFYGLSFVPTEAFQTLQHLADEQDVISKYQDLANGTIISPKTNQKVHHHSLRQVNNPTIYQDELKRIRERLFEKMRNHDRKFVTWQSIVKRLERRVEYASLMEDSLNYKTAPIKDQTDDISIQSRASQTLSSPTHCVYLGDWYSTEYRFRFVETKSKDGWSPIINIDPPPTDIVEYKILIASEPPIAIKIDKAGECLHELCPILTTQDLESLNRFQLQLDPYTRVTLGRSSGQERRYLF